MNPVSFRKTSALYHAQLLNRRWLSRQPSRWNSRSPHRFRSPPVSASSLSVKKSIENTLWFLLLWMIRSACASDSWKEENSPLLFPTAKKGDVFTFSGPLGYFMFIPSPRQAALCGNRHRNCSFCIHVPRRSERFYAASWSSGCRGSLLQGAL